MEKPSRLLRSFQSGHHVDCGSHDDFVRLCLLLSWAIGLDVIMLVFAEFKVEEILPRLGLEKPSWNIVTSEGLFRIRTNSSRLECFKRNITCVGCRIKGDLFRLEASRLGKRHDVSTQCLIDECQWCSLKDRVVRVGAHLNLYAKTKNGLLLMTQDHIFPKSRGGGSEQSNLQTMCCNCNCKKGATLPIE